jgi:pantetheine-phosphate adenylyltransferase
VGTKKVALYPGSFDPVTLGHLDLIKRATLIFDEVIVGVAHNTRKKPLFTIVERIDMMREATKGIKKIRIEAFDGLVIDFARKNHVRVLVRGLRMISDFEYELQMALTNRRLDEKIETVFLMPSEGYSFLSSTLIKEAAILGADISSFVPKLVINRFQKKLKTITV